MKSFHSIGIYQDGKYRELENIYHKFEDPAAWQRAQELAKEYGFVFLVGRASPIRVGPRKTV